MLRNSVIDHEIITDLAAEPVTLEELKMHLNMLFETEGSYEFNDDDAYLTRLISVSRKYLEQYTGLSFGQKTITAYLRNDLGNVEVPFGPIVSITSIKDATGNTLSSNDYKLLGGKYKSVCYPTYSYLVTTYVAGFEQLPEDLKQAILEECAWRYNHRGEEKDPVGYCKGSLELASSYKRTSWIA